MVVVLVVIVEVIVIVLVAGAGTVVAAAAAAAPIPRLKLTTASSISTEFLRHLPNLLAALLLVAPQPKLCLAREQSRQLHRLLSTISRPCS